MSAWKQDKKCYHWVGVSWLQGEWALWISSNSVATSSSAILWFRDFPTSPYVEATGGEELPKTCLLQDICSSRRYASGVPRKPGFRGKMHPENHMSFDKLCTSKNSRLLQLVKCPHYSPEIAPAAQNYTASVFVPRATTAESWERDSWGFMVTAGLASSHMHLLFKR